MSARGAGSKPLGFGANREGGTLHPARLGVPVLAPLLVEITVGGEVGSAQISDDFERLQKGDPVLGAFRPTRGRGRASFRTLVPKKHDFFDQDEPDVANLEETSHNHL